MIHKKQPSGSPSAPTSLIPPDARGAVRTSILRSESERPDGGIWIDVDAPARALRRRQALARIRKREAAILQALGGGSSGPPAWREIPIQRSPVDRPALAPPVVPANEADPAAETSRPVVARGSTGVSARVDNAALPCLATGAPLPAKACRRGLVPHIATVFPSLTIGFMTALLGCLMFAWLAAWVVLRFCQ